MTVKNKPIVIAFDIDGCLTTDVCWTPEECLNAIPYKEKVDKYKELYKTNFVYILTSRRDELVMATLSWLEKNEIKYQAIKFNQPAADVYYNDKAINIKDL